MSSTLHQRLLHSSRPLIVLFLIATILLTFTNNRITSATKIKPVQFFSIEKFAVPHPVAPTDFNEKIEQISARINKSTFHRFFYLDFAWALLLLGNIYVLTCKARGTKEPIRWLIVILALAYGFDVLENITYISESPHLVLYLEYTNQAKLLFYALGVGSLLYFAVYRGITKLIKK